MIQGIAAIGFVGMVLTPCAVAIYSKLGSAQESHANEQASLASAVAEMDAPAPPTELNMTADQYTRRPVPLSTTATAALPPAPVAVPSLRQVAEQAAREAVRAQAEAAKARVEALQEASRAASKRAAAAAKLAEAAEFELVRASQAALQAEAMKLQARAARQGAAERDYLPHDHPSLDFPRSRVQPRRVA
jgi:type IV secretory pathway VirB10-like protein